MTLAAELTPVGQLSEKVLHFKVKLQALPADGRQGCNCLFFRSINDEEKSSGTSTLGRKKFMKRQFVSLAL
jgi:hypothetical protein